MTNFAECGIWCWDPRVQEASRRVSCQDASARREQSVVCDVGIRCSDGSAGAAHRCRRGAVQAWRAETRTTNVEVWFSHAQVTNPTDY